MYYQTADKGPGTIQIFSLTIQGKAWTYIAVYTVFWFINDIEYSCVTVNTTQLFLLRIHWM